MVDIPDEDIYRNDYTASTSFYAGKSGASGTKYATPQKRNYSPSTTFYFDDSGIDLLSINQKAKKLLLGSLNGNISGGWHDDYSDVTGGVHQGFDIWNGLGTPLYSISDGRVTYIKPYNPSSGTDYTMLVVEKVDPFNPHNKIYISYLHLAMNDDIKEGMLLAQGDFIGTENEYGNVTGSHTHIEITGILHKRAADPKTAGDKRTMNPSSYFNNFYLFR